MIIEITIYIRITIICLIAKKILALWKFVANWRIKRRYKDNSGHYNKIKCFYLRIWIYIRLNKGFRITNLKFKFIIIKIWSNNAIKR